MASSPSMVDMDVDGYCDRVLTNGLKSTLMLGIGGDRAQRKVCKCEPGLKLDLTDMTCKKILKDTFEECIDLGYLAYHLKKPDNTDQFWCVGYKTDATLSA